MKQKKDINPFTLFKQNEFIDIINYAKFLENKYETEIKENKATVINGFSEKNINILSKQVLFNESKIICEIKIIDNLIYYKEITLNSVSYKEKINKIKFFKDFQDFNIAKKINIEKYFQFEKQYYLYRLLKKERVYTDYFYILNDNIIVSFYNSNTFIPFEDLIFDELNKELIQNNGVIEKEIIEVILEVLPEIKNKIKIYCIDRKYINYLVIIDMSIKQLEQSNTLKPIFRNKANNYYISTDLQQLKEELIYLFEKKEDKI